MLLDPDVIIREPGPWAHREVSANGARFHIVEAGEGPLIVFLHGFPTLWWSWRHQLRTFVDAGYRVVSWDQRGHGDSSKGHLYSWNADLRDAAPTTLVLKERAQLRKTHLMTAGDFTRPADEVTPGVLSVLHAFKPDQGPVNRLDLARWIAETREAVPA